jgi:hypothetical protein
MGILADLFVASPHDAPEYEELHADKRALAGRFEVAQHGGFTDLEFRTLWAIVAGEKFDVGRHMLEDTSPSRNGAKWLFRFPEAFVDLLADIDATSLARAAVAWAKTDELQCDPGDVEHVVVNLHRLAASARRSGRSMYLWGSL